jgi:uncharacterized membrane-anchored protein
MARVNRPFVRGKAGESTRKMQFGRIVTALVILLLIWLAHFLYSRNIKTIMSLGATGSLVVGGLFLFGLKLLEKKGTTTFKHTK